MRELNVEANRMGLNMNINMTKVMCKEDSEVSLEGRRLENVEECRRQSERCWDISTGQEEKAAKRK